MLYRTLCQVRDAILAGRRDYAALAYDCRQPVEAAGLVIDYFEIRNGDTLAEAAATDDHLVIAVAAKLGGTRLIDNLSLRLGKP